MYALARTQHSKPPLDRIPITKNQMGFFSSRKSDPAPVFANSQPSVPIKSKWYTSTRSKKESKTSPLAKESVRARNVDMSNDRVDRNLRPSIPSPSPLAPRLPSVQTTDQLTVTLAQRLDELAVANADGLLGDDEYRMLRQNLFERFGAGEQIPTELPTVRLSTPDKSLSTTQIHMSAEGKLRATPYASSTRSSASRTSSVTTAIKGVIHRAAGRVSTSSARTGTDYPDNASMKSRQSQTSYIPTTSRKLTSQSSNHSLRSSSSNHQISYVPHDLRSLSSQQTGRSTRTSRTSASKGPPSSYHRRPMVFDSEDDYVKSSAEIRAEIQAVEAEGRRLLDNFNGLEVSTITRHGRPGQPSTSQRPSSSWTIMPEKQTNHDVPKQPPKPRPPSLGVGKSTSGSSIAQRKISLGLSSIRHAPPPPLPVSHMHTSALSSHHPSSSSPPGRAPAKAYLVSNGSTSEFAQVDTSMAAEDGHGWDDPDPAIDGIRRKKLDTMANYEEKLEYLRAKLKGAELRERLAK